MNTSTNTYDNGPRQIIANRYQLVKELGQGSFSIIYQAYDLKEKRDVALKQEKSDKARRILHNEYAFLVKLQSLDSPHIVRVYDFESLEDVNKENFIVMDLKSSSLA